MRTIVFAIASICVLPVQGASLATVAYQNTFDFPSSLYEYSVVPLEFSLDHPVLHEVSVGSGELRIASDSFRPNGPGNPPVFHGGAAVMRDTSSFGAGYRTVLSQSLGTVSWSFNVANQDDDFNNLFEIIFLSSGLNPTESGTVSYRLLGGGLVGDTMRFLRTDSEAPFFQNLALVSSDDGLGVLPERGSFRMEFEPTTNVWSLFGHTGPEFVDPESVNHLLFSVTDGTHTNMETPFMGFSSSTSGSAMFDNLTVRVVPEPRIGLIALGGVLLVLGRRARTRSA